MAKVVARIRVGQQVLRVVACDPAICPNVHLKLQIVESGHVTDIGMVHGQDQEAVVRSGRLMRVLAQLVYGEDVDASVLVPDEEDEGGVLPGTATIYE